MKTLEKQVAIVTGGGHGIGRAISLAISEAGAHTIMIGRRIQPLKETVNFIQEHGGIASAEVADVTHYDEVITVVDKVVSTYGKIDLLVNNAASFQCIGPVWNIEPASWWEDITVNLFGTFVCCRAVLRHMIERRAGKIINLGGGGSLRPLPYGSGYGTSKAALVRFTETLDRETAEFGVRAYTISPGMVDSDMTRYQAESSDGKRWLPHVGTKLSEGRVVDASLAAKLCVFLATPEGDGLGGRYIEATEDYQGMAANSEEIINRELYVLRRATK